MKKLLLIISVAFAAGCHDYKTDVANLTKEKETLQSDAVYKDSMINDFVYSMNEIETNLGVITQKQEAISASSSGPELSKSQKERISDEISSINALMQTNRDKIAQLQKNLKKSNAQAAQFEKAIALLNQQVENKNNELIALNQRLAEMDTKVAMLNTNVNMLTTQNDEKATVINNQTKKMHTAYYTKGTYKELEKKHVLIKEGGFLGLGKEKKVTNDFDPDAFAKVDITETKVIPIESKDAKIVTTHPTSSYTLETKEKDKDYVTNLVINDPDQFWKASKYLVVMVQK